jgi:signal transduction histidine kinase
MKDKLCFEVQDTGMGIPKEFKVFDCFATSKPNRWGLGLSITQQIMRAHHGSIDYRSKLGHGTTFRILLPVSRSFIHARRSASKPVNSLWPL